MWQTALEYALGAWHGTQHVPHLTLFKSPQLQSIQTYIIQQPLPLGNHVRPSTLSYVTRHASSQE